MNVAKVSTLLSLKLQIWQLPRARSSLTFRQTIECGFTLELVRDIIITYSQTILVLDYKKKKDSQIFYSCTKLIANGLDVDETFKPSIKALWQK